MSLRKNWNKLTINTKFTVMILVLVIFIISALGVVVYVSRQSDEIQQNTDRFESHTNDLHALLQVHYQGKLEYANLALQVADEILNHAGTITYDTLSIGVSAINQQSNQARNMDIYPLLVDNRPLWNNYSLVDRISSQTDAEVTIYQRIDGGFLMLSTSARDSRGQRLTGTYIPDGSPMAQAFVNNENHQGRIELEDESYLTAAQPIIIDGQVEAGLSVRVPDKDLAYLQTMFSEINYLESGYPMLIDNQGNILIHPTQEGIDISGSSLFETIQQMQQGGYFYQWPEDDPSAEERRLFFRYFEPYETWVAVTVSEDDFLKRALAESRNLVLIGIFSAVIVLIIFLRFIMKRITDPIIDISSRLETLALGTKTATYQTQREDEIGKIAQSLNKLIEGLNATAVFANEIEKKNFDHEFKPLSDEDILGNALIDMKESLKKAELEDEKRRKEDEKRNWTTEGLARFSDILRQNNDNLEVLSFDIIRNLVKYLNINQGGLFILNDEDENNKFLELMACYAFDRQKFLTKKVEIGEGLTGTCFLEKQTIYLKQIPDDYINITSGLGDASPNTLLIVPLKLNEEIYGVVELASFRELEPHEIEFLEKIAESIASTLSSVKINLKTAQLLEQSQQQAEEMKAQEEEMRQNMEELEATQEEMARKSEEQKVKDEEVQADLKQKMEEMHAQEEELRQTMEAMEDNQAEIERVKNELGALVDNMPGIVYQCLPDEDFTMDYISDYCEKITGYTADDFVKHRSVVFAELIHPDDIDKVNKAIEEAMQKKSNFYTEYRIKDNKGNYHHVGEHGSLLMDKSGEIHHLQGLVFELKQ